MVSTLVVNVEDELTYFQAGNPLVSGAFVTVLNLSTDSIGTTRIASNGSYTFLGLEEGTYKLFVAAPGHEMTTQIVSVAGSSTTITPFIQLTTVSYTFAVTPVSGTSEDEVLVTLDGNDQDLLAAVGGTIDLRFVTATVNVTDLAGRSQDDTIYGSQGKDFIHGKGGDDFLDGFYGNDWIFGQNGSDTLYGGRGNDVLNGGRGDDDLFGEIGHDELKGGAGDDELRGGSGNDILNAGGDDDWLYGNSGNDELRGGSGQDVLFGGNGDDRLLGGADSDIIEDGSGKDWVKGGDGADLFIFVTDGEKDRIVDYDDGIDRIDLGGVAFDDLTITTLALGRVRIAYDNEVLIVKDTAGLLVESNFTIDDFA